MKRRYYRKPNEKYTVILHRKGMYLIPFGIAGYALSIALYAMLLNILPRSCTDQLLFIGIYLSTFILIAGAISGIMFLLEPNIPQFEVPEMPLQSRLLSKKIVRKFNPTALVDILKLAPKTSVGYMLPTVKAYVADDSLTGFILLENLGTYGKLNNSSIQTSLSGLLKGKGIENFEVVASNLTNGENWIQFTIENLVDSERIVIKNGDLTPFASSNPHDINLGYGLIWHARKVPMMSIIARTGAGKTKLASYITGTATLQKWSVTYNSAKQDKYVKQYNGSFLPEDIIETAEHFVHVVHARVAEVARADADDYADIGLNDILVVFDEIGHLNALLADNKPLQKRWKNAIASLCLTGRSAGIHLLLISQYATIESFVPASQRAQVSDVVIMLGNAASSATERQYIMGGFPDLPDKKYGIGEGLAKVAGAGSKWETPHFYRSPWFKE